MSQVTEAQLQKKGGKKGKKKHGALELLDIKNDMKICTSKVKKKINYHHMKMSNSLCFN